MHLGALAVGLVLFVSLVPAYAQSAGTVPKVGYLGFLNEPEASPLRDAFLRGLRDLGYVPGQNIIVDVRRWTTEGQLRQVLSELIRLKPTSSSWDRRSPPWRQSKQPRTPLSSAAPAASLSKTVSRRAWLVRAAMLPGSRACPPNLSASAWGC